MPESMEQDFDLPYDIHRIFGAGTLVPPNKGLKPHLQGQLALP